MPHTAALSDTVHTPAIRFVPIVHMQSGETATLIAETEKRYEERAVFGRAAPAAESSGAASLSSAAWLAAHIENVANDAHTRTVERPIMVSAPLTCIAHPDTAIACDAAIRRTNLCAQEICIEVTDASLAQASTDSQAAIENLRRVGFRVSLDATRSWQTPLNTSLRLLLDSIRVDARRLDQEPELADRVDAAVSSGMAVIAQNVAWRDGDYLARLGIEFGLRPRADA